MLRNKHFIAALIITPILSILGYFAVDTLVSEKPHAAREGDAYELVARSGCRYQSGHCTLVNGDFRLDLEGEYQENGGLLLSVESAFPLEGGGISVVGKDGVERPPASMQAADAGNRNWSVLLEPPVTEENDIHLAVSADSTWYYAESSLAFTRYATSFGKDFRDSQ